MHFALVLALALGSVQGVATSNRSPLPGCTVTLTSAGRTQQLFTDVEGRYRFASVEPGRYELVLELDGLETVRRSIDVVEGVNEQPPADLPFDETQVITLACGGPPCNDSAPETVWDWPSCTDYELDGALIDSMTRGDRSALALLRDRYSRAFTYAQKHRLAAALLRHVPDDRVYWDELFEHARNAVRFTIAGFDSDEYRQWCAERGHAEEEYRWMADNALWLAAEDPRSRPLLLEALGRDEHDLIVVAIRGLASQRDLSALPVIERALERLRASDGDCCVPAYGLVAYHDERADQLALRYLDERSREEYLQARNAPREEHP